MSCPKVGGGGAAATPPPPAPARTPMLLLFISVERTIFKNTCLVVEITSISWLLFWKLRSLYWPPCSALHIGNSNVELNIMTDARPPVVEFIPWELNSDLQNMLQRLVSQDVSKNCILQIVRREYCWYLWSRTTLDRRLKYFR